MNRPCVLAVDDDPLFLRIVEHTLQASGYAVVTAGDLASARARLENASDERFVCALIDYQLPDGYGTELLHWLHARDAALAVVMATASEQRSLVKETMVEGACNFLQKPVNLDELREAVELASSTTRQRLEVSEMRRQVESAGQTQERMLESALRGEVRIDYRFYPKSECGGDFLVHHRFPNGDEVFTMSDVSGHDLAASMHSSFFHGWLSALLNGGGDIATTLETYNRMLIDSPFDASGSIAVTALEVRGRLGCMIAWTYGGTPPVFVDQSGWIRQMGARNSCPLGWFDTGKPTRLDAGIPNGPVWIWTDGLESLADMTGADPLSVAEALLAAKGRRDTPLLDRAIDDVLVARIWPHPEADRAPYFHPLIAEEHGAPSVNSIDAAQARWRTSLRLALPGVPGSTLHDVLLGSREALLNAIEHGCSRSETAAFQVLYHPGDRLLRVRVADPGAGYDFDWRGRDQDEPAPGQRGLVMIRNIPSRVTTSRHGADLTMDYLLTPGFEIIRSEDLE